MTYSGIRHVQLPESVLIGRSDITARKEKVERSESGSDALEAYYAQNSKLPSIIHESFLEPRVVNFALVGT